MENCKYCDSNEFILEPKNEGEDIITANMVALKCNKCGKWLKWVKKEDRKVYLAKTGVFVDTVKEPIKFRPEDLIDNTGISICDFTDNSIDARPEPTKEEFAINILNELRREMLMEQTYFRSNVIGAIDSKIKKLRK